MAEVLNTRGDSFARFSRRIVLMLASSYAFGVEPLSADAEIGEQTAPFLAVTASGAARALSFVAAVERDGGVQIVYNAGATYNVVVKNSAAATLITLAPGEFVALVYDATAWAVLWKVTASSVPIFSPPSPVAQSGRRARAAFSPSMKLLMRVTTAFSMDSTPPISPFAA